MNKKSSQRGIRYSPKNPINNKNDSAYFFLVYMHFYFSISYSPKNSFFKPYNSVFKTTLTNIKLKNK